MAEIGALGIGLSLVFGGFVLVLLAELYYVFFWKRRSPWSRRINSVSADCAERANPGRNADGLMGYSRSVADAEFVAKLFPIRSEVIGSHSSLYMQGVIGGPRLLFTIKEETKEDMEYEESAMAGENNGKNHSKKKIFSPKIYSESTTSPMLQQQQPPAQRQFAYSIGLIQQQQKVYAESPSPKQQSVRSNSSDNSPNGCPFPNGRFPCSPPLQPACTSSPSWRTTTSSSSSSSVSSPWHNSEPPYAAQEETSSSSNSSQNFRCISNPIYEVSSQRREDPARHRYSAGSTPFGTPVSSPSLLDQHCETPPLTPPLTPIKAPLAAYSVPLTASMFGTSAQLSSDSCSSSKCSSPSFQ